MKCPNCGQEHGLCLLMSVVQVRRTFIADNGKVAYGEYEELSEDHYGDDVVTCWSCHKEFPFELVAGPKGGDRVVLMEPA